MPCRSLSRIETAPAKTLQLSATQTKFIAPSKLDWIERILTAIGASRWLFPFVHLTSKRRRAS
ncbi:protein of unknown function [Hyphomicrobium sp. MC1]|nr:protein of unknown function [Hyphomicrobium sp. MC1]